MALTLQRTIHLCFSLLLVQLMGTLHPSKVNVEAILRWVTLKQMEHEGGFQGRTNKLVDSCYSFWQWSIPAILLMGTQEHMSALDRHALKGRLLMNQERLQQYILQCCQQTNGGLRDKPGKSRDNYHTCYALSGLSVAQQYGPRTRNGNDDNDDDDDEDDSDDSDDAMYFVYGNTTNRVEPTHPVYNLRLDKVKAARLFFDGLSCNHDELMSVGITEKNSTETLTSQGPTKVL